MNVAIVVRHNAMFHEVLGFIDALDSQIRVDVYVGNEHDWVGLLRMCYQSKLENRLRLKLEIINESLFITKSSSDKYDFVVFTSDPIAHPKSLLLRDVLAHPVTDKLVPQRCISCKFDGDSQPGDAFYRHLMTQDSNPNEELTMTCLLNNTSVQKRAQFIQLNTDILRQRFAIPDRARRFHVVHLVQGKPLETQPQDATVWRNLGYETKSWTFDDVIELVTSQYPQFVSRLMNPGFCRQLVVYHESGIAPALDFVPLKHDGFWDVQAEYLVCEDVVAATRVHDPGVLGEATNGLQIIPGYTKATRGASQSESQADYFDWFIASVCGLGILVLVLLAQIVAQNPNDARSMLVHKSDWTQVGNVQKIGTSV